MIQFISESLSSFVLLGLFSMLVGVPVVAWGMLADWFRRRRSGETHPRCPKCWYNMTGHASLTCPECGHTVKSEKHLYAVRRDRWWIGIGLVLFFVGMPLWLAREILRLNWPGHLPTSALIYLVNDPCIPDAGPTGEMSIEQRLVSEVWRRYAADELSPAQRSAVAAKQFAGNAPVTVRSRQRWPRGVPVWVELVNQFQGAVQREAALTAAFSGSHTILTKQGGNWTWDSPRYWPSRYAEAQRSLQCIGMPPADTNWVTFQTQITEAGVAIWSGPVTASVDVSGTIDQILQPVRSAEVDASLRLACIEGLRMNDNPRWISLSPPVCDAVRDVTFAITVEIVYVESVVAHGHLIWTYDGSDDGKQSRPWPHRSGESGKPEVLGSLEGDTSILTTADLNDAAWQIRVRGDGALALRDFSATRYWAGEFTIGCGDLRN